MPWLAVVIIFSYGIDIFLNNLVTMRKQISHGRAWFQESRGSRTGLDMTSGKHVKVDMDYGTD